MWNIKLQALGVNQWLDEVEQRLTLAGDLLDVIEEETEQIKTVWDSGAEEIWKAEFQVRVSEMRAYLAEMNKVAANIGKVSKGLAEIEMSMTVGAQNL